MSDADEKLNRLVLRLFRQQDADVTGHPVDVAHLRTCPDVYAVDATGGDGPYGCDTGCEYVELEANIRCEHGCCARFDYGEFGDMAGLIEDMDADT